MRFRFGTWICRPSWRDDDRACVMDRLGRLGECGGFGSRLPVPEQKCCELVCLGLAADDALQYVAGIGEGRRYIGVSNEGAVGGIFYTSLDILFVSAHDAFELTAIVYAGSSHYV